MGENANVFQIMQIGVEATKGTPIAATKILQDVMWRPSPEVETDFFVPAGHLLPTIMTPLREWGTGTIEGRPSYNNLTYLLQSLLKTVTPVRNIPSTGLSYTWTWKPSSKAEETVTAFTTEYGSADRGEQYSYTLVNGIELSGSRKEMKLGGSVVMRKMADNTALTGSLAAVASTLLFPTQGNLYMADTQAGLTGATALARVFEWKVALTDRYGTIWPVRTADTSFAAHAFATPKSSVSLKMAIDAENAAILTAMRAGAAKWLRVKYVGPLIETTYYYTMQIDCKIAAEKPDARDSVDEVATRGWNFQILHDATWGAGLEISVTNEMATL